MEFIGLTLGIVAVGVLVLIGLARATQGHGVADLLDWKPTRSPEVEAQNEIDDVAQMIAAQNELRRKRGAKEITEADVRRQAAEDQALRARGTGPFAQGASVEDDDAGEMPPPRPRRKPTGKRKRPAKPRKRS